MGVRARKPIDILLPNTGLAEPRESTRNSDSLGLVNHDGPVILALSYMRARLYAYGLIWFELVFRCL